MAENRWSRGVNVHEGALTRHGWKEHEPAGARRAALLRSVRADGYKTTVDRLVFLENIANRQDNEGLHVAAHTDLEWLREHEARERERPSRRVPTSRTVHVRGSRRARPYRRRPAGQGDGRRSGAMRRPYQRRRRGR
jgi:hypothetical protein